MCRNTDFLFLQLYWMLCFFKCLRGEKVYLLRFNNLNCYLGRNTGLKK